MGRGDVYWADLPSGRRPVLVIAREELARGATIFAVPLSSANFSIRARLPNCVAFHAGEYGLTRDCVAQCELAGPTIDIDPGGFIGRISDEALRDVIRAVGYVMDADCEPQ